MRNFQSFYGSNSVEFRLDDVKRDDSPWKKGVEEAIVSHQINSSRKSGKFTARRGDGRALISINFKSELDVLI